MEPIVLSTWSFGAVANDAAWPILAQRGTALDAVETGCRAVESDPAIDSVGLGGLPDRSGRVSLDASIMAGPSRCGSVACLRRHVRAVSVARAVMERTQHVMLVGEDADAFADSQGFESTPLLTTRAKTRYEQWRARYPQAARDYTAPWQPSANVEENTKTHDTVGVLALDEKGQLAGACSTSGRAFKAPGRVGDSPIIGHGLYVHPRDGAAVATGTGELVMGVCGAFLAVELMRSGTPPLQALVDVLKRIADSYDISPEHQVGMIALRPDGAWASAALRKGYSTAVRTTRASERREPESILL